MKNSIDPVLLRLGISPEVVRHQTAVMVPKGHSGRRGLPEYVIKAMYAEYLAGASTRAIGARYNRSGQCVFDLFENRGLPMRKKVFGPKIIFQGEVFTLAKGGYFRSRKSTGQVLLHQRIWEFHHGQIPEGHQVSFKDGNPENRKLSNLFCAPLREVVRHHYQRRFPNRAEFTPEQRRAMWRVHNRLYMRRKAKRNLRMGLRSDGQPFRRNQRVHGGNAAWQRLSDADPGTARLERRAA